VFVTESTFALPVYRWPRPEQVFGQINQWWRGNQETGKASVLYAYSLGKAQHLLSSIDPSIGPIFAHPSVEKMNELYRQMGVALPPTTTIKEAPDTTEWGRALILAPPSHRAGWLRRIGPYSAAFASGWMQTQSSRRRPEHGFVLSDHADWPGLLQAVASSGADRIAVTHGYDHVLVRWLREQGKNAWRLSNPE
jgi:putative mRNA 3-end processing factor